MAKGKPLKTSSVDIEAPSPEKPAAGAAEFPKQLLQPGQDHMDRNHSSGSRLANLPGLVVTFQNVTYRVRSSRNKTSWATLLDQVTAFLAPGEMTAILGPSGSGEVAWVAPRQQPDVFMLCEVCVSPESQRERV